MFVVGEPAVEWGEATQAIMEHCILRHARATEGGRQPTHLNKARILAVQKVAKMLNGNTQSYQVPKHCFSKTQMSLPPYKHHAKQSQNSHYAVMANINFRVAHTHLYRPCSLDLPTSFRESRGKRVLTLFQVTHYCNGCCIDRDDALQKCKAAILEECRGTPCY